MVKPHELPAKYTTTRNPPPRPINTKGLPAMGERSVEVRVRRIRQLGVLDVLMSLIAMLGALALAAMLWIAGGLFTLAAVQQAALGPLRGAALLSTLSASHPLLPWIIPAAITAGQLVLWPGSRLARAMTYQFGAGLTFLAALLWCLLWLLEIAINYQGIISTVLAQPLNLFWQQLVVTPNMLDPTQSGLPLVALAGALILAAGPEQLLRWAWAALRILGDDLRGAAGM